MYIARVHTSYMKGHDKKLSYFFYPVYNVLVIASYFRDNMILYLVSYYNVGSVCAHETHTLYRLIGCQINFRGIIYGGGIR